MEVKITRHGLQIIPTNQPMDDVFIEEVLGLYKEGDQVTLVRVSTDDTFNAAFTLLAAPPPPYILETEDPPQTEKDKVE